MFSEFQIYEKEKAIPISASSSWEMTVSSEDGGQNGDRLTTLPMIIRVGETNSASLTSFARLFSMENTCDKGQ